MVVVGILYFAQSASILLFHIVDWVVIIARSEDVKEPWLLQLISGLSMISAGWLLHMAHRCHTVDHIRIQQQQQQQQGAAAAVAVSAVCHRSKKEIQALFKEITTSSKEVTGVPPRTSQSEADTRCPICLLDFDTVSTDADHITASAHNSGSSSTTTTTTHAASSSTPPCLSKSNTDSRSEDPPDHQSSRIVEAKSCGHVYHENCIRSWMAHQEADGGLNQQATCPCCRSPLDHVSNSNSSRHRRRVPMFPEESQRDRREQWMTLFALSIGVVTEVVRLLWSMYQVTNANSSSSSNSSTTTTGTSVMAIEISG